MRATDRPAEINLSTLHAHLLSYHSHVPEKIQGLEELRLNTLPETLLQRKKDGGSFLEKTEVTSLVEWKLKHGTYRPNLAKLVASNSVKDVRETTKNAFEIYEANGEDYGKSITVLNKLKGIGPATSSLLLSCYDPLKVPFFSDELYRYLHWEEAKSKGWDRKINYTIKEYKALFERVAELRERLKKDSGKEVSAIDIEKGAYVLGKDALPSAPASIAKKAKKSNTRVPENRSRQQHSRIEECRHKGLNGSPTYDTLGYELDKEFVIKHTGGCPRSFGQETLDRLEQKRKNGEKKAEIIGVPEDENKFHEEAGDDRVARDLGTAYHEVRMEEYEEWQKKGFKAKKEELDLSKKEQDRLID
ncbi:MAG: hypothetical protein ASARMPRED_000094 [Alectoria sarmentosa]|nr:MAG: hypothetical protein ASARMPRED_000094 [Alectoria sarmentosa]